MPAISIDEAFAVALQNQHASRFMEAESIYRQILNFEPRHTEAMQMLGVLCAQVGRRTEAIELIQRAIQLKPNEPNYYNNLGLALAAHGQMEAAINAYRRAIELNPDVPVIHNNLGNALKNSGEPEAALDAYRAALRLNPNAADATNYLFFLHFDANSTPQSILIEHRRWNEKYARPLMPAHKRFSNDRSIDRRLRVGYISSAFQDHPVGRFLLPLFENHDHQAFEFVCYSDVKAFDAMSQRLAGYADQWHDIVDLNDEQLAQRIEQDGVDIVVDLTLHGDGSRLLALARKPAPVQVSYLGYIGTTGMDAVDYRFTDPYIDPPGLHDQWYSEKSVRLPGVFWCYPPPPQSPPVCPLPALLNGHITFGSMNNLCKVTSATWAAWRQVMRAVPNSRLVIHAHEGGHRQRIADRFAKDGIPAHRLDFVGRRPLDEYFAKYNQIDISLDSFPYAGGTTTCDSLWMGVPVVSLAGQTGCSRGGLSILSNVGLPELVASSISQYVDIAVQLSLNPARIAELRSTLRQRMMASPLMDGVRFARGVEDAFRAMWSEWCGAATVGHS
ncbi:MAG TPA: tetratricopeptide repeat protein [Tepidisphaeraceae bacterium]|nr:tetratricopeptide repeat protein [Tepidisphaeraceae bacterium]